jgi:hypothetical protein
MKVETCSGIGLYHNDIHYLPDGYYNWTPGPPLFLLAVGRHDIIERQIMETYSSAQVASGPSDVTRLCYISKPQLCTIFIKLSALL